MSGTKAGGQKAAATNKAKYGKEFYANIGRKGGRNGHTGGFAANLELAKIAGAKGGKKSKRGPAKHIKSELGWNDDQVTATIDEIDEKIKILNIELERLRHETTQ